MERDSNAVRRCGVYTRKSSEEGLEQDFNSLHAQREASEAFIKSQQGEGWKLVKTSYDDGGLSGGNMERPALQRLLEDIRHGLIDVVVVYKVDRLTRSLADFAKMVEVFDAQGVSFVAVTQQFNTTTSMGRLTLNVLLSFAQFEREVTGERIRDKIAASKRKGIWMGGCPSIGYDVRDRRLVVNQAEAETVRRIYHRYLKTGSVPKLKKALDREGVVSKTRVSRKGNRSGGQSFSRGALYELLSNPIYIGEIRHKRERHPGQHEAILERELWEKVQQRLLDRAARSPEPQTKAPPSPLAGKVFDETGEPLYAQSTVKGRCRYRYYVSRALVRGSTSEGQRGCRVPGPELERAVAIAARIILDDKAAILEALQVAGMGDADINWVFTLAADWRERLLAEMERSTALTELVEKATLTDEGIRLGLNISVPGSGPGGAPLLKSLHLFRFVPLKVKRRGVEIRLIINGGDARRKPDSALLKAFARARGWFDELAVGRVRSLVEIARREGLAKRYLTGLTKLAFVSPAFVEAIAEGEISIAANLQMLMDGRIDLPVSWKDQEQLFNTASATHFFEKCAARSRTT
jgi:DNA invertase Pin-like site-specific DNA recombinase